MHIAIKKNKPNMKTYFLRKIRNRKLIICNGKQIIMFHLFPSRFTEMHIATKRNEKNTNNKKLNVALIKK